jgi:hypothetical protein
MMSMPPSTEPAVKTCPVGLVQECEMIERVPERRQEIIAHAIRVRERERLYVKEIRNLITWHPVHTTKVVLVSGSITFILVWLISGVAALGQWYAHLKAAQITFPIPFVGDETLHLGSHVPTSTVLAVAGNLPAFDLRQTGYIALTVMGAIILEKVVMSFLNWRESQKLTAFSAELQQELAALQGWSHSGRSSKDLKRM